MVSESTTIPNHHNKLHKTKPRTKSPSPRQNTSISTAFRPIPWVLNSSALPTQKTKRVSFVDKASRWRWWSDGSDRVEPPPPGWRHTPKGSRGSNSTTLSLPSLHVRSLFSRSRSHPHSYYRRLQMKHAIKRPRLLILLNTLVHFLQLHDVCLTVPRSITQI
jgi:hypothetical protein